MRMRSAALAHRARRLKKIKYRLGRLSKITETQYLCGFQAFSGLWTVGFYPVLRRVLSRSSSGSIPFFVGFYPVLPCALSRALKMPARGGLMGSMEGQLRCFFTSYVPRLAAAWLLFYVHEVDIVDLPRPARNLGQLLQG